MHRGLDLLELIAVAPSEGVAARRGARRGNPDRAQLVGACQSTAARLAALHPEPYAPIGETSEWLRRRAGLE